MILTCRQFTRLVTEAHEGRLSGWQRAIYRFHQTICPGCKAFEKGMNVAAELLRELPNEPPPDRVRNELMERFRQRKQG